MSWPAVDALKQQIPLLEYLQAQDWKPARRTAGGRVMGLCPLHADRKPSFLVDPNKNLFYCYGCGRGGDVIRFAELYHGARFPQAMALLRRWSGVGSLLEDVTKFYQAHLDRHPEAVEYLYQRGLRQPQVIEELRIGYAPGRCLGGWLLTLGYSLGDLQQAGLLNAEGIDLSAIASYFRWKATSMAAVYLSRRRPIVSCPAPRAVCTRGSKSVSLRK